MVTAHPDLRVLGLVELCRGQAQGHATSVMGSSSPEGAECMACLFHDPLGFSGTASHGVAVFPTHCEPFVTADTLRLPEHSAVQKATSPLSRKLEWERPPALGCAPEPEQEKNRGSSGGGTLALVVGLIMKYSVPKTQLSIMLRITVLR